MNLPHIFTFRDGRSRVVCIGDQRIELVYWGQAPGFYIHDHGMGDEYDLSFHIGCIIGVYVSFSTPILRRKRGDDQKYETLGISLSFHHDSLWWRLWSPVDSWSNATPRWRDGCFDFPNFFFGKDQYSATVLSTEDVVIEMPEGNYPAIAKRLFCKWTRPRWPWPKTINRVEVELKDDLCIPFPGKGENAWDCGDDGTCSIICVGESAQDGITAIRNSVMRVRTRYGSGVNWQPSENWAKEIFKRVKVGHD
jgi:hypothetical protein